MLSFIIFAYMEKKVKSNLLPVLFIYLIVFFPNFGTIEPAFSHIHDVPTPVHSDFSNHLEHSFSISIEKIFAHNDSRENLNSSFFYIGLSYSFSMNFKNNYTSFCWHPPKQV